MRRGNIPLLTPEIGDMMVALVGRQFQQQQQRRQKATSDITWMMGILTEGIVQDGSHVGRRLDLFAESCVVSICCFESMFRFVGSMSVSMSSLPPPRP